MKLAQAVVSQTIDGQWKIFVQSDRKIEQQFVGSFDDIIAKLKEYGSSEWEKRSI